MAVKYMIYIILGYLSGSVLYAYLIPKYICGVDVRELAEDKNPGTANAFVYAGLWAGALVLFLELAKGFLPVYVARGVLPESKAGFSLVMAAPVAGHAIPLFSRKKGGKCIAVSFGVLLGLFPEFRPALLLALVYLVFSLLIVIQPHLLRSIAAFFVFALLILFLHEETGIKLGCLFLASIVIVQHLRSKSGGEYRKLVMKFAMKRGVNK